MNCVGMLVTQEGQFGDVTLPESGGLSPSDAGNRSLRAGGARSLPSSRVGPEEGVSSSPLCVPFRLPFSTCSPASTFSTDPAWEHPQTPLEGVPLQGGPHLRQRWHVVCASVSWGRGAPQRHGLGRGRGTPRGHGLGRGQGTPRGHGLGKAPAVGWAAELPFQLWAGAPGQAPRWAAFENEGEGTGPASLGGESPYPPTCVTPALP